MDRRIPVIDREYPRASWNELIKDEPWNGFVNMKDSGMRASSMESVTSLDIIPNKYLKFTIFLFTLPLLGEEREGLGFR